MQTPIPLLLVTGFLGSGKTTLLNRFLRLPNAGKLGAVVNEFGQVGIDGALLGPGDIVELGGGCVCCASGNELWESAVSLIERAHATHILVETSGIAEVGTLLHQYDELPIEYKKQLDLRGVLCLVDVLHIEESIQKRPEAKHQMEAANRLLLTKTDLAHSGQMQRVHEILDELSVTQERTLLSGMPTESEVSQLLSWAFEKYTGPRPLQAPHEKGQLCAFVWEESNPLLERPLTQLLEEISGLVLRVKGFVYLKSGQDSSLWVLQWAGSRLELHPCTKQEAEQAPEKTTLVFISERLDERWLERRLFACRAMNT